MARKINETIVTIYKVSPLIPLPPPSFSPRVTFLFENSIRWCRSPNEKFKYTFHKYSVVDEKIQGKKKKNLNATLTAGVKHSG